MSCSFCNSNYQAVFAAEVNIHVSGPMNAASPGVFVFPRLLICMDCGYSSFVMPEIELTVLAGAAHAGNATTSREQPAEAQCQAIG
jgi:hypothetical protein